MAIEIHYAGRTYIAADSNAGAIRVELANALTKAGSSGFALWRLPTTNGFVNLVITRFIPIAIEDIEPSTSAYESDDLIVT